MGEYVVFKMKPVILKRNKTSQDYRKALCFLMGLPWRGGPSQHGRAWGTPVCTGTSSRESGGEHVGLQSRPPPPPRKSPCGVGPARAEEVLEGEVKVPCVPTPDPPPLDFASCDCASPGERGWCVTLLACRTASWCSGVPSWEGTVGARGLASVKRAFTVTLEGLVPPWARSRVK